ncbi:MAG: hypothetical protein PHI85_04215 [Victivallaceae bacterium]|nr:hypothetical protein [Victivallaceae bacterium]
MSKLGVKVIKNHADYRLMSRRELEKLSEYNECNLYLRGIVPLLGLRSGDRALQASGGDAKNALYPPGKMLMLDWDGITSFTIKPIRLISLPGFLMMAASFVMLLLFLWERYFGSTVRGVDVAGRGLSSARRHSAFLSGSDRGICRKNIHRGQTASALFDRVGYGGGRR